MYIASQSCAGTCMYTSNASGSRAGSVCILIQLSVDPNKISGISGNSYPTS